MTNGLPRGMASFYHVGVVGGRDDNDGKRGVRVAQWLEQRPTILGPEFNSHTVAALYRDS